MTRLLAAIAYATLALLCQAQGPSLAAILSFETDHPGGSPGGWGGGTAGSVFVDGKIVHGGRWSARIERPADSAGSLSGISKTIPMDFAGKTIEMRGFLRTEDVTGFVGMWMREDADSTALEFDNMQRRELKGTNEWSEYSIVLPVNPAARQLVFGVFVTGTGTVWADDLQLLVDGKPVWEAPKVERPKTPLDTDQEFDAGSGIVLSELTPVQIENLATLGKVWGFLKYHHPAVTGGQRHWDYDLFRIMPAILAAPNRGAANTVLVKWIAAMGVPAACNPCAKLDASDIHLRPALEWLDDQALLGAKLRQSLRAIYVNRPSGKQFYVALVPGVANPEFLHEPSYRRIQAGDAGYHILGAYRFWNIIEYWFPYRDVLGEKWDEVLKQSIPKIALAKTPEDYQREMMALIARAHDTHANLWSSLASRPPVGPCQLPVNVRFIENRAVVTSYSEADAGKPSGLKPGDAITEMDGAPVVKLVESWAPYYAASNEPTRLRDIAHAMTRGRCGETTLHVRRENEELTLKATRVVASGLPAPKFTHDLPGETFRRLSDDVAYLKLSSIKIADVRRYIGAAAGTKGLIIDIRNYPSEFVVFALGSLLVDRATPFARFTRGDLSNPGAFHWDQKPTTLTPESPHYSGKVVILVDEVSLSQAEYTSMAFRSASGAKVVGSTTAGADGNVSPIPLPGGLGSMISGIGVFYPDKRPTQRIGIVPDIEAKPTIAGIRAGRDEVLEEGVRQILGREAPAELIEKIAKQ